MTNDEAVTWLKDKLLANLDNLPDPDVSAEEIAENLDRAWEVLGSDQTVEAVKGASSLRATKQSALGTVGTLHLLCNFFLFIHLKTNK